MMINIFKGFIGYLFIDSGECFSDCVMTFPLVVNPFNCYVVRILYLF
jgi:hypothetical protein